MNETAWFERLFMNLLSYSVILLPIAFVVIATKTHLFPNSIVINPIVQLFVYGSNREAKDLRVDTRTNSAQPIDDDRKLLLKEQSENDKKHIVTQQSAWTLEFLWCLFGLQISYLMWGLLQEKIMTTKYTLSTEQAKGTDLGPRDVGTNYVTFHDSQFLVFINRIAAFITAILALVYTRLKQTRRYVNRYSHSNHNQIILEHQLESSKPSAPLYEYVFCSLSNIMSSWCQYEALKFVNFPTQCLSKSCKVIPVMLMSRILLRKRYSKTDYLCAFLLALGMFVFMLNQTAKQHSQLYDQDKTISAPKNQPDFLHGKLSNHNMHQTLISGLIILALYLTFDSFTSNWQQSLYTRYNVSNWQMMAAINFYSILLTLTSLHQLGNLEPALRLLASSSLLLRDCMIMSVMSSIGQTFVYYTIKRFGSVIFAIIMTLRQFFSILLSCLTYDHQLNLESSLGLILVFLVVSFQVWHKSSAGKKRVSASNSQTPVTTTKTSTSPDVFIQFKSPAK